MEKQDEILSKFLGPLELQIMNIVWGNGDATVQEVLDQLNKDKDHAYTTIMTIMSRLSVKKLLSRIKIGRLHKYRATCIPEQYIEQMSIKALDNLFHDFGDAAIARFVDHVGINTDKMDMLKDYINRLDRGELNED